ncbi:MAG: cellulase family glycosylhydrolase [Firmicutes bacterium]|nr:cellulase family glycosylhydrolase [Bacillota bacterium]
MRKRNIIICVCVIAAIMAVCLINLSASSVLTSSVSRVANWQDNDGYNYSNIEVKIKNTSSSTVTDWEVTLDMPGDSTIFNSWNGDFSLSGNKLTIKPASYNTAIAGNSEISVGFIFKAKSNELPKSDDPSYDKILKDPQDTSSKGGNVTVDIKKDTSWNGGGKEFTQLTVTLKNESSKYATNWLVNIGVPDGASINQAWGSKASISDNKIKATCVDYTQNIEPNSSVSFGIVVQTDKIYIPAEYEVTVSADHTDEKPEITYNNNSDNNNNNNSDNGNNAAKETTNSEKATEETTAVIVPVYESGNGVSTHGRLKVSGTQLVGEKGEPVVLHGMSSHGIAWFPDFTSEQSIVNTKAYGANVFRVAMYTAEYNGYTTSGEAAANTKAIAYKAIDAAAKNDMYAIIDWHILSDNNPQMHKDEAIAFFDEVSKKYADDPAVIYEICNEPHGVNWSSDIKPYAQEVIKTIRANAPQSLIIVGTNTWSQDVDEASKDLLDYDNIMYTLHFYAGTHYLSNFKPRVEAALANGAPIFVTEWGSTDASGNGNVNVESTKEWLAYLESKNISWANWSLANKDESSAALLPAASANWSYDDLSASGKLVFDYMKENPGK